jgi:membrane protease YdiL (CAAX protease family)
MSPRVFIVLIVYAVAASMQALLRRVPAYGALYDRFPFYVPETLKATLGVLLCLAAAVVLYGWRDHFALRRGALRGLGFGLLASSPLLIGLATTRGMHMADPVALFFLAVFFPLTEDVMSRGFAFGALYRREGMNLWTAAIVCALVTGAVHVEKGQSLASYAGLFVVTGIGGVLFAWLMARWRTLWAPFALHASMNLWWEVFSVSRTALGGWFPFVLQAATVVTAILLTMRWTAKPDAKSTGWRGDTLGGSDRWGQTRLMELHHLTR